MPRARESRYTVLCELKTLAREADNDALECGSNHEAILDAWYSAARETVLKIKSCTSVKDLENIEYPTEITIMFGQQSTSNKDVINGVSDKQKEHVHDDKQAPSEKTAEISHNTTINVQQVIENVKSIQDSKVSGKVTRNEVDSSTLLNVNSNHKTPIMNIQKVIENIKSIQGSKVSGKVTRNGVNSSTLLNVSSNHKVEMELLKKDHKEKEKSHILPAVKKKQVESLLTRPCTPKKPFACNKNTLESSAANSQQLMQTPVADKTFTKGVNETIILDSNKSNLSSKILDKISTCVVLQSKSYSKKEPCIDKKESDKQETEIHMKTRSGSKRKSSASKTDSNKKRKIEGHGTSSATSATKTIKVKYPTLERNVLIKNTGILASENKTKVSAVIVPSMQVRQASVISKEQQILEEIKKKEEKANENRKRVLAERQLKAEENKRKREEKREKTQQKRFQMEKEKREMELKKSPAKTGLKEPVKKTAMKTRVKDLIEQSGTKDKKSGVLTTSKQNGANTEDVPMPKTPASQKSFENENYELTPIPDSSTYDFSEDEDDSQAKGKPIPLWAQGVHLKCALIQQFYYPPNTDELFGSYIESPDLAEIFCVKKKCYKLRTSSAVWNSPPSNYMYK